MSGSHTERGVDRRPRALDQWREAGREAAALDITSFAMTMQRNGVPADEALDAVIDYGKGLMSLSGAVPAMVTR